MSDLSGKTAIITGASRGIGAATARYFADKGAKVVLAARSGDEIARIAAEIGDAALAVPCDVARFDQVETLIRQANDFGGDFGGVDIVINNAGLIDPIARITDSDPKAWGRVIDVNLMGVYHTYRAALPMMQAQGHGTIINISSGAATNALEGWSHYCASKAAVLAMTWCGHKEMAEHGIRVMGLSPGTVATDMQVQIKSSGINPVSQMDPSVHIPAEWVARGLAYLCGPGGDAWLGQDFSLKTEEGRKIASGQS